MRLVYADGRCNGDVQGGVRIVKRGQQFPEPASAVRGFVDKKVCKSKMQWKHTLDTRQALA